MRELRAKEREQAPSWAKLYTIGKTITDLEMIHYYSDCNLGKGQWFYTDLNEWSTIQHYMTTPETAKKL